MRRTLRNTVLQVLSCMGVCVIPSHLAAQESPTLQGAPLAVFLDCADCGLDFIRTVIPWVDYVRDRTDAHVHVLETALPAGAGTAYTMAFLGRGTFTGVNDTLRWVAPSTATADSVRRGLAHLLELGLIRYVASLPVSQSLQVTYLPPTTSGTASFHTMRAPDPWNGWVFNTGASGYVSGQQSQHSGSVSSSISANRTTEAVRANFGLSESYSWSSYLLPDFGDFRTGQRSYDASAQLIQSVTGHWSVGEHLELGNSSFDNERLWTRAASAVEYDLFPYTEATNHQLAIQSSIGILHIHFIDTTLDNRITLTGGDWRTSVAYEATQPWGSASVALTNSALLTGLSKSNVNLAASWNLRITKGLSLSPGGSFSWIRSQPYLPRAGLTPEEILVQQQQQATDYTYSVTLGLAYTFGSSFNNSVNPRFNTGSVLTAGPGNL